MSGWKEYKLGELMEIKYGKAHKHLADGIFPLYGSGGIMRYVEQPIYECESILIPRKGTLGNLFYMNKPFSAVDTIFWSKINTKISIPKFLYYALKNQDLESLNVGSAVPSLTTEVLNAFPILIPELNDQKGITEALSALDDKIDLLHRQNKTLEELAETLFKQWFLEEVDDAGVEEKLSEYVAFDPREKIDRSKPTQFFDMKCLSNIDMNISDGVIRTVSSASYFRNNDTLMAKITPCLENGKTGFVMNLDDNEVAKGSTEFIVMRSKGFVSPYWIYCLARNNNFRELAIASMNGTSGRQRVQMDMLKNIEVKMNKFRMSEYHKTVSPFFDKIKSNSKQIRTLTQLRDTLLPKLMSGEIQILDNYKS